jgi:hypothetical protein
METVWRLTASLSRLTLIRQPRWMFAPRYAMIGLDCIYRDQIIGWFGIERQVIHSLDPAGGAR